MSRGESIRTHHQKSEMLMVRRALNTVPGQTTAEHDLLDAARLAERRLDKWGDWETAARVRNAIENYRESKTCRNELHECPCILSARTKSTH